MHAKTVRKASPTVPEVKARANARVETLVPGGAARLAELEQTIDRGLQTFVEVGRALVEINERRLYRHAGHPTFEDYALARWGMSRSYAYRKIDAARVVELLRAAEITPLPANEGQARELAKLIDQPELLRGAWIEASTNSRGITARAVRTAVEPHLSGQARGPRPKPLAESDAEPSTATLQCPHCGHEWQELHGFSWPGARNESESSRLGKARHSSGKPTTRELLRTAAFPYS